MVIGRVLTWRLENRNQDRSVLTRAEGKEGVRGKRGGCLFCGTKLEGKKKRSVTRAARAAMAVDSTLHGVMKSPKYLMRWIRARVDSAGDAGAL